VGLVVVLCLQVAAAFPLEAVSLCVYVCTCMFVHVCLLVKKSFTAMANARHRQSHAGVYTHPTHTHPWPWEGGASCPQVAVALEGGASCP